MKNELDIEKQYWKRYHIMQKKLCQYQYYRIDKMRSIKYTRLEKAKTKQTSLGIY